MTARTSDGQTDGRGLRGRIAALGRRFGADRRGGTAVQAIVLLPVIILAFVLAKETWELILIRDSLHTGTYLATRYLSLYPPDSVNEYDWEGVAEEFVAAEMKNNPFVDPTKLQEGRLVEVTLFDSNECGNTFEVAAKYDLFAPTGGSNQILPTNQRFVLEDVRQGEVLCD